MAIGQCALDRFTATSLFFLLVFLSRPQYKTACFLRRVYVNSTFSGGDSEMICYFILYALAYPTLVFATKPPTTTAIILRDLARPRFFGAAANTSFLFQDKNYTNVISKQVSRQVSQILREGLLPIP